MQDLRVGQKSVYRVIGAGRRDHSIELLNYSSSSDFNRMMRKPQNENTRLSARLLS
jgi:hypothetical protein